MSAVCDQCVEESALQAFVRDNAYLDECDYCGRQGEAVAAEVSEVGAFILEAVGKEFVDPANELPYETREGGYQGNVIDSPWDLFDEIGFELANEQLMEDLCDSLGANVWLCRKNYFQLTPTERMRHGWSRFCEVVKHQRRFTFWSAYDDSTSEYHPDYLPTARVLTEVAALINAARLTKPLGVEDMLWRARVHPANEPLDRAADFAAPPIAACKYSNRMSPAGISMFYGAESPQTAVAEVLGARPLEAGKYVSTAGFRPCRELVLLNLVELPPCPSFFDEQDDLRHALYFLNHFAREVSQTVVKDGREHIEYVPTQVFCEYIRCDFSTGESRSLDGIRYRSAQDGQPCYVIFANHNACLPGDGNPWRDHDQILLFEEDSVRRWTTDGSHSLKEVRG